MERELFFIRLPREERSHVAFNTEGISKLEESSGVGPEQTTSNFAKEPDPNISAQDEDDDDFVFEPMESSESEGVPRDMLMYHTPTCGVADYLCAADADSQHAFNEAMARFISGDVNLKSEEDAQAVDMKVYAMLQMLQHDRLASTSAADEWINEEGRPGEMAESLFTLARLLREHPFLHPRGKTIVALAQSSNYFLQCAVAVLRSFSL